MNFQFQALNQDTFSEYFSKSKTELQALGAYVFESDECPCYPCRVSLVDAEVGELVLAISYKHLTANSPYCSSGPIFVREKACTASVAVNEVPELLRHRLQSVRAYDAKNLMIDAQMSKGVNLEAAILKMFSNEQVAYIHMHNGGPGCYNCSVLRA